ncbi:NitT/TauT family transport system substrate-binding protein [Bosea sp. BK604]|nr:NitT/TauT family transport system substrate-binding protein [Bosea sp. BK604]
MFYSVHKATNRQDRGTNTVPLNRRFFLQSLAASSMAGPMLSFEAGAQGRTAVNMQIGWITGGNQIGEICAKAMGFYEAEGLDMRIQAGGPNIDGVAVVASGRYEVGQVSSSPSLMLAASQDVPVVCFAAGCQKHPYTFYSLKKNPVREPKDFIGKKVGIQSTGIILLRALLAQNKIPEKEVTIIPIGADMSPLLTGQVDVVTGWETNTTALKVLGPDRVGMTLWDAGVKLYALPYYATAETLKSKGDLVAKYLRASGKGWAYAHENRDQAVALLVKEYPNLVAADERAALDVMLSFSFGPQTKADGWGTMDPAVWQEQIDLHAALGQFSKRTPKLAEVMTLDVLKATADARPRIG